MFFFLFLFPFSFFFLLYQKISYKYLIYFDAHIQNVPHLQLLLSNFSNTVQNSAHGFTAKLSIMMLENTIIL